MRRDVFLFFLKAKNEDKLKQNFAQVKGKAKFCLRLSPAKYPNPQPPLRSCECGLYRLSLQTPPALPVVSASYIGSAYRPPPALPVVSVSYRLIPTSLGKLCESYFSTCSCVSPTQHMYAVLLFLKMPYLFQIWNDLTCLSTHLQAKESIIGNLY